MIINGKKYYWKRWSAFQGHSVIFLCENQYHKGMYSESDIIIARKERHEKPEYLRPKLLQECPFDCFNDGFNFSHPTGEIYYNNFNATKINPVVNR